MPKQKQPKAVPTSATAPNPYDVLQGGGDLVQCGTGTDSYCCHTQMFADRACKRKYGKEWGYSNVWAKAVGPNDPRSHYPCAVGSSYECRANTTPICPRDMNPAKYNKDGPFGTMFLTNAPANVLSDEWCQNRYGRNAIFDFQKDDGYGKCVIADWKQRQLYPSGDSVFPSRGTDSVIATVPNEPTDWCCNPANIGQGIDRCDPQTCFGKPACDTAPITQTVCSDKDNIATDPLCADTCKRLGNSAPWCLKAIQKYCTGKNLETETCRQFCTQPNIDDNPDLATFCDNAYSTYCASKDYSIYDQKRQSQLCGCINSPIPNSVCVDAKCTNNIGILLTNQRNMLKSGCPDVCQQNFIIDGNAVVDIDKTKWEQYCPGYPVPGSPDNPWTPSDNDNKTQIAWYVGGGVLAALVIAGIVLVAQKE